MAEGRWRRPSSVPRPTVWRRFEGAKTFPNGVRPRFRVQDFTEDLMQDVLDNMRNNFVRDEPLCEALDFWKDEVGVAEMLDIWKEYTKHGLVLVCLLENKEELGDETLPVLAGLNMTGPLEPDSPHPEVRSENSKKLFRLLEYGESQVDCFQMFKVTELLYALGLSVDRRWRGHGIGLEILRARFDLGRAVGLKVTMTVFTAIASQTLAERVGFETIFEIPYEEYKVDGEVVFKNMKTPTMKIMAARIS